MKALIPLTRGKFAVIDVEDLAKVLDSFFGEFACTNTALGLLKEVVP